MNYEWKLERETPKPGAVPLVDIVYLRIMHGPFHKKFPLCGYVVGSREQSAVLNMIYFLEHPPGKIKVRDLKFIRHISGLTIHINEVDTVELSEADCMAIAKQLREF